MFLSRFLDYRLILFSSTIIAQIFNSIAEPVFPIGIAAKKVKTEKEIYPATVEAKIRIFYVM